MLRRSLTIAALATATFGATAFITTRDTTAPSPAGAPAMALDTAAAAPRTPLDSARLAPVYARAAELPRLRSLLVWQHDSLVAERYFRGARASAPANIKSASKSVLSALVGVAIAEGKIGGLDATLGELLPAETRGLDSAKRAITLEDLLTMRAGLESTSFGNYGSWVSSRNWVRDALRRPMEAPPGHLGGPMIYSTGTSHLVSAALTRATGTSTLAYARRALGEPLGIRIPAWTADPQGIYFGGNEMRLTPRDMGRFGLLYLNRGRTSDGTQVVPAAWVDSSWVPRTRSGWSGNAYGYGWWSRPTGAHTVHFAWGYGGQFVFVVPSLDLVVVTTSASDTDREGGHLDRVHALLDEIVGIAE